MTEIPDVTAGLVQLARLTAEDLEVVNRAVKKTATHAKAERADEVSGEIREELDDPDFVAQKGIDLTRAAILGNLQGLLPNENLATLEDATRLGDGVVLARAMAAQDLAAMRLWVQEGSIESAMVLGLVADKIRAGLLQVDLIVAAGRVQADGASLTPGGMTLNQTNSAISFPNQDTGSKITPPGSNPFASFAFFEHGGSRMTKGIGLNADGIGGSDWNGEIRLCATSGTRDNSALSTAILTIRSRAGSGNAGAVEVKEDLAVNRDIQAFRNITASDQLYANGYIGCSGNIGADGNITAGGRLSGDLRPSYRWNGSRGGYILLDANSILNLPYNGPMPDEAECRVFISGNNFSSDQVGGVRCWIDQPNNRVRVENTNSSGRDVKVAAYIWG
jgi:hypothetical protein